MIYIYSGRIILLYFSILFVEGHGNGIMRVPCMLYRKKYSVLILYVVKIIPEGLNKMYYD